MPLFAHAPIAIAFLHDEPSGINRWNAAEVPAGCAFWRYASQGRTFYTAPADHANCAVGTYTHGLPQPAGREAVLEDTVGFMVENSYLQMSEVPGIPVLPVAPAFIAYGPLDTVTFQPDLVLLTVTPYAAMLLYEAALRAGETPESFRVAGRPACALLPLALQTDSLSFSFGCKGNRTFTGLPAEEMYACLPASKWDAIAAQLSVIERANTAMETYYRSHQAQFPILA